MYRGSYILRYVEQGASEVDDQKLVRILRALADANRFRMVQEIAASGELSCGDVGGRFPLAQPTISHHLKILAEAGVLNVRRDGQHGIVSVNHDLLREALALIPGRLRSPPGGAGARSRNQKGERRP
jgi:ArsR family transcriptional regulator